MTAYTYLLSVSLMRVRSITPAPRLRAASTAALGDRCIERAGGDAWLPERWLPQAEARPDAVAAQR